MRRLLEVILITRNKIDPTYYNLLKIFYTECSRTLECVVSIIFRDLKFNTVKNVNPKLLEIDIYYLGDKLILNYLVLPIAIDLL